MKNILIVDDEPCMLRVLQFSLERAGYRVTTAPDGRLALARVLAAPPDALISDIKMPDMDGRELIHSIGQALPDRRFPIFVMTSLTAREEREWVRALDGVEFLEKPVSPRQLVARLARVFKTGACSEAPSNA